MPLSPSRAGLATFALALPLWLAALFATDLLYDNDAYYHLAVARDVAARGPAPELPWARFSLMHEGFGDKELLFHLLLAPAVAILPPLAAGKTMLAAMVAAVLALVAAAAAPVLGRAAPAAAIALPLLATQVGWRLVRLRPELLALALLLAALGLAARERERWLAPVGLLFALGYTAFHAYLGLFGLLFAWRGLARARWRPGLLLYPALGVGAGLVLHPHFPKNLEVWTAQTLHFHALQGTLDVGTEIRPVTTDVVLFANLGFWAGLLLLALSARPPAVSPDAEEAAAARRHADAWGVAAVAFGALALLMSRFASYALAFGGLWALWALAAAGRRPGRRLALPGGRSAPAWVGILAVGLAGLPTAAAEARRFAGRTADGVGRERLRDREAVAAALAEREAAVAADDSGGAAVAAGDSGGAAVAAPWGQTPVYMLWAPRGRYLNVLDPVFMALPHPEAFAAQERLFRGEATDPALTVAVDLASRFVAFSRYSDHGSLERQLAADPRFAARHLDLNAVFEVLPGANRDHLLDWTAAGGAAWPRHPTALGRAVEGFVALGRLPGAPGCATLETAAAPRPDALAVNARGSLALSVDGSTLLVLPGDGTPGAGSAVAGVPPGRTPARIVVESCGEGFEIRTVR